MVTVDANTDEYIIAGYKASKINKVSDKMEIDIEEERNIEAHQEKLNIDIESTKRIENIHKHHKIPWGKIYEVIQKGFFEESENFPEDF